MVYSITFVGEERPADTIWLSNPKVGDVLKIGMLASEFEELEYWTIVQVLGETVKVQK